MIFFQCKIQVQSLEKNPNPHQIEGLISHVLSDCHAGLVRANSLKMIYSMLRDNQNLYPQIQERLLKRFIEKQVQKLRQVSETEEG